MHVRAMPRYTVRYRTPHIHALKPTSGCQRCRSMFEMHDQSGAVVSMGRIVNIYTLDTGTGDAGRARGAPKDFATVPKRTHNKPLRLFSYQTKERLHYTHGPRSSRVPRPASATLCAAAQRRNCRGNANTARGKDAQHNMLGNFAAGRFFESLEPSQHCGASNNARVQAPCQPSPWVDRTHLFEMPCAAKLFEYGF